MSKYSDEQRAEILARAREAIDAAEATLATPRPHIEPRVESRFERWDRELAEQDEKFARENAEPRRLTDYEARQHDRERLAGMVEEQKEFIMQVLSGVVAEMQDQFAERLAKLAVELGQVRADVEIAKAAHQQNNNKAEGFDLPTSWLKKIA